MLEPDIALLSETDQHKIVALITKEKAERDSNDVSKELFNRLMNYM
jgi:hypothetical protein